jgi:hypothetical protein
MTWSKGALESGVEPVQVEVLALNSVGIEVGGRRKPDRRGLRIPQ